MGETSQVKTTEELFGTAPERTDFSTAEVFGESKPQTSFSTEEIGFQGTKPVEPLPLWRQVLEEGVIKPVKTFYGGTLKAAASTADLADFYADKIAGVIGVPETKNSLFELLRDHWSTVGEQLQKEGLSEGVMKKVYSGLGQAGWDVPLLLAGGKFLKGANLPTMGAVAGYKEGGLPGAGAGAVGGAAMHGTLKGLAQLPGVAKYPVAFFTGAATTPGDIEEKVAGGAVMTGLSVGKSPTVREFRETFLPKTNLYQASFNRFDSIENAVRKAKELGADIQPGEDAGVRAREYLGIGGKVKSILEDKTFTVKPDGTIEITGEGLKPILKEIPEANRKDFTDYLIAKRTAEDLQRAPNEWSSEFIATPEQTQAALSKIGELAQKYGNNLTQMEQTSQRLYDYQKRVLHLLVDSGNISQESFERIISLNPHYVPFNRVMDLVEPTSATPKAQGIFSEAKPTGWLKRIQGSEREIIDPIESIVKNTYRIVDVAERNTVARNVARLKDVLPDEMTPVRIPMRPIHVSPEEIDTITKTFVSQASQVKQSVKKTGGIVTPEQAGQSSPMQRLEKIVTDALQSRGMTEGEANTYLFKIKQSASGKEITGPSGTETIEKTIDRMIKETVTVLEMPVESTIFRPSPFKPKGNVIEYYEGGDKQYMELSKNLYEAMTGLNETSSSLLIKMLAAPTRMLRTGATIVPEFSLRNPIRDQWTAFLQTKLGFKPFIDPGRAIADIIGKSDVYYDFLRTGGSYSGFVELSRDNLQKEVQSLIKKPNVLRHLNIISKAQDLSELFEQATRLGVYKAAGRHGKTPVEAGFQAREATVDFGRRGSQTKDLNSVIAFFNAGIQGLDKSIRTAKEDPAGFAAKATASITLPSILLYALNRNDPDYKELPRWQKDLFWIVKAGDTHIRIPKPFLYGQVFGSTVERFMEYLDERDPEAFKGLLDTVLDAATPIQGDPAGVLLPTAVKGIIENESNWSLFREAPVVPEGKQELLPPYQHGKYVSETAKAIGKQFNTSPAKIENLIQSFTGGSGRYVLQGSDKLKELEQYLRGQQADKGKRPREAADIPGIKGFVTRPVESVSQSVNDFYERADEIEKAYRTYAMLRKRDREDEAKQIIDRYPQLVNYQAIQDYKEAFTTINKNIEELTESTLYSDADKRKLIKEQEVFKMRLAQEANKFLKQSDAETKNMMRTP